MAGVLAGSLSLSLSVWLSMGLGVCTQHAGAPPTPSAPGTAQSLPLLPKGELGTLSWVPEGASEQARAYFQQGLLLHYGFNAEGSLRSFQAASAVDPGCALCAWGEALVLGPDLNTPVDPEREGKARAAVERGLKLAKTELERGLLGALQLRYDSAAQPRPADRARAYTLAMQKLVRPAKAGAKGPSQPVDVRILAAANVELRAKLQDLALAQNDMRNLLNSTDIATVWLGNGRGTAYVFTKPDQSAVLDEALESASSPKTNAQETAQ